MLVKSPTINKFLLILIFTFLTACASDSSLYQYNFGRPVGITAEKVNKLQKEVTTSDDVISLFGKPDKESMRNSVIKLDWTESNYRGGSCALCKSVFDNK